LPHHPLTQLKVKGLTDGTLNIRINAAAARHMITEDMAAWAHDVRLDANDPRHADETRPHHTPETAQRAVDFAAALAEFLFVLPMQRGRDAFKPKT
jgi:hypothetical protein